MVKKNINKEIRAKLYEFSDKYYRNIFGNYVNDISAKIIKVLDIDLNYPSDFEKFDFKLKNRNDIIKYKKYFYVVVKLLLSDAREVNIKVDNIKIIFDNFYNELVRKYNKDVVDKIILFYNRLLANSNTRFGDPGNLKIGDINPKKFGGNTSYEYFRKKFGL